MFFFIISFVTTLPLTIPYVVSVACLVAASILLIAGVIVKGSTKKFSLPLIVIIICLLAISLVFGKIAERKMEKEEKLRANQLILHSDEIEFPELVNDLRNNYTSVYQRFVNKKIKLRGIVSEVNNKKIIFYQPAEVKYNPRLQDYPRAVKVSCWFDSLDLIETVRVGDNVQVTGLCQVGQDEMVLLHCSVIR